MLQGPMKDREEVSRKLRRTFKEAHVGMAKVVLRSFLTVIAAAFPIALISVILGLEQTAFPLIAGVATVLLVHVRYTAPRVKKIGVTYEEKVKEILEEARKNTSKEG